MDKVTIGVDGRIHCHGCGKHVTAKLEAQDPAPCGCAWVWENGRLIAVQSLKTAFKFADDQRS